MQNQQRSIKLTSALKYHTLLKSLYLGDVISYKQNRIKMNLQIINCTNQPKMELYKKIKDIQDLYKSNTLFELLPIKDMGANNFPFELFFVFRININLPKTDDNFHKVNFYINNPFDDALNDFVSNYEDNAKFYSIERLLEWNGITHHKYRYELFETMHHYKRLKTHIKGFELINKSKIISLLLQRL